ncbi:urease accessory protein UreF [Nitrospira sp.]|nr:urease accessory protein UreF [Nitrospira sp.]
MRSRRPLTRFTALELVEGIRLIDSFFPSGGFAYSSGLEAAVQGGAVKAEAELQSFLQTHLRFGLGTREAVAVARARQAAVDGDVRNAIECDWELESLKLSSATREASRQMGRQVARMLSDEPETPSMVSDFATAVETKSTPGHLAVALGVVLGAQGWSCEHAVAGFLYHSLVGTVSAALKLLPLGQQAGQRLLKGCLPALAELSVTVSADQVMAGWTPLHDLFAMRHGGLEHRLFRS